MADELTGTSSEPSQLGLPTLSPISLPPDSPSERFWGNAKPPTSQELEWLKSFGAYDGFDPAAGRMSQRVLLEVANLRQATQVIVYHHYLHRGRTMAQLAYWILVDRIPVGVLLYAYPRLSVPLFGIEPMNLLELARLWISPTVQGQTTVASDGSHHAVSVASCAVANSIRMVRLDWYRKYPGLPDIDAIVSWADTVHHEGTLYRAANFREMGRSGGSLHGNRKRANGGRDQLNPDYENIKTLFLHRFPKRLTEHQKRHALLTASRSAPLQLELLHA